jgi:hypothetical protein
MKKNIAIVAGGDQSEVVVWLKSAKGIYSFMDKEKYNVPKRVQDVVPIKRIWSDGIFLSGNKFSKCFAFSNINYQVASR